MSSRRGQLSIVIIVIGVVVVSLTFVFFSLQREKSGSVKSDTFSADVRMYESALGSCLRDGLDASVSRFFLQGGYQEVSPPLVVSVLPVPIYSYDRYPSREDIVNGLELSFVSLMDECAHKVAPPSLKLESSGGNVIVSGSNPVQVTMDYHTKVSRDDHEALLQSYTYQVPLDIDFVRETISEFIFEQQRTPNEIPIGYLSLIALRKNVTFSLDYHDVGTVVYTLNLPYKDSFLRYRFAQVYSWGREYA